MDQGFGIKKEDLTRLFERYYRVENNSNISGFCIGLYLVAEIINVTEVKYRYRVNLERVVCFVSVC